MLSSVLIGLAVLLTCGFWTPASASSGPWVIKQYAHLDCLFPEGAGSGNSVQIVLGGCGGDITSYTQVTTNVSSGYVRWKNVANGKCLNVQGGNSGNGVKIIQYTCGTSSSTQNDQWKPIFRKTVTLLGSSKDFYILRSLKTKQCINVQGGAGADWGSDLHQWDCDTSNHMDWFTWDAP
jgi:hypothetical protein